MKKRNRETNDETENTLVICFTEFVRQTGHPFPLIPFGLIIGSFCLRILRSSDSLILDAASQTVNEFSSSLSCSLIHVQHQSNSLDQKMHQQMLIFIINGIPFFKCTGVVKD